MRYTTRISTPCHGDLVFSRNSTGALCHVGLWAGNGYMWHAPRTGDVVKKSKIWSTDVFHGRVN